MITYANALKLKEAGYFQPIVEAGQFWYGKKSAGFDCEQGSLCIAIGSTIGNLQMVPVDGTPCENNKYFVYAPSAAEVLSCMSDFTTDGLNIFRVNGANEIEAAVHVDLDVDNAAACLWYFNPVCSKKVSTETLDGIALGSGLRFGDVFNVPGTLNGIYEVSVKPWGKDEEKEMPFREENPSEIAGFAGTYSPSPLPERICKNCKHWASMPDFYDDPEEDPATGMCKLVPQNAVFKFDDDTCGEWDTK